MNLQEEVQLLKGVPIFARVELAKLKLLAFTGERMTFGTGQELCHQGEYGDAMYVILQGLAEVLIDTPSGPVVVAELEKNNFIGEMAILVDVPRTATVRAAEPLTTLKISKDMFCHLAEEFPQMAFEMLREVARRLDDTNRKLEAALRQ